MGIIVVTSSFLGHELHLDLIRSTGLPAVLAHAQEEDHKITGLYSHCNECARGFCGWFAASYCFGTPAGGNRLVEFPYRRGHNKEEYAALLDSLGMNSDPKLMINLPSCNEKDAFETVQTFFRQQKVQPTALMCYSDYIAMLCYPALQAGAANPRGCGDHGLLRAARTNFAHPPLSTVDVGYARIGTMVIELILRADEWFRPEEQCP